MFHCVLIFDVLKKLADSFQERDIELLLVLLKSKCQSCRETIYYIGGLATKETITLFSIAIDSSVLRFMENHNSFLFFGHI